MTPLHITAFSGNIRIIKILLEENKVDINEKDEQGRTALTLALLRHHKKSCAITAGIWC